MVAQLADAKDVMATVKTLKGSNFPVLTPNLTVIFLSRMVLERFN